MSELKDQLEQDIEKKKGLVNQYSASLLVFGLFSFFLIKQIVHNYTHKPSVVVTCPNDSEFDYLTKLDSITSEDLKGIQVENILYSFVRKSVIALSPQSKIEALRSADWLIENSEGIATEGYKEYKSIIKKQLGDEIDRGHFVVYEPLDYDEVIKGISVHDSYNNTYKVKFRAIKTIRKDNRSYGKGLYDAHFLIKFKELGLTNSEKRPVLISHYFEPVTKEVEEKEDEE